MTRVSTGSVRDARPPEMLVRATNPVVRTLVQSPLGRFIPALAVVDHVGRRSGARRRVVVGWHELDGRAFVVTPAAWRANFSDGASARVRQHGRSRLMRGTLVSDAALVADTLAAFFAAGGSPASCGLRIEADHRIDAHDVELVGRSIVWFDLEA